MITKEIKFGKYSVKVSLEDTLFNRLSFLVQVWHDSELVGFKTLHIMTKE